jgi:site-specific recombinase XerD
MPRSVFAHIALGQNRVKKSGNVRSKMANIRFIRGTKKWRVRWRATNRKAVHGRLFQGSRTFKEKADALRFYLEIEEQEKQWRSGLVAPQESIVTVLGEFHQYSTKHTLHTQKHYQWVLAEFAESLPDRVQRITELKSQHIHEYLYQLRDRGLKNRTLNNRLTAIKSFCRFCAEKHGIPNIASTVKMLTEDPPDIRWLTTDEYQKVLKVAAPMNRDRIVFLANTGLRASEYNLAVGGIHVSRKAITITGKGRKKRTIPLNKLAQEVFPRLTKASAGALLLMCRRVARQANVPAFGPHALRHYFATQLLLKGVPILKVSILLGHASVTTTQRRYAHILSSDLANVTDVLV